MNRIDLRLQSPIAQENVEEKANALSYIQTHLIILLSALQPLNSLCDELKMIK